MTSRQSLRILIVTGIFPPDIGGPATYVPKISESLARRGHLITVVTLSDCLQYNDAEYPVRVVRVSRRPNRSAEAISTGVTNEKLFYSTLVGIVHKCWYGDKGYKMVFLPSEFLGRYVVHLNHVTMVLHPELGSRKKTIRKGVKRFKKELEAPNANRILMDNSLDY